MAACGWKRTKSGKSPIAISAAIVTERGLVWGRFWRSQVSRVFLRDLPSEPHAVATPARPPTAARICDIGCQVLQRITAVSGGEQCTATRRWSKRRQVTSLASSFAPCARHDGLFDDGARKCIPADEIFCGVAYNCCILTEYTDCPKLPVSAAPSSTR